jgi:3-deoxy-D-manno-octulosonate 8-phosphate phosphatase (KDO 8-P phosphatase)
METSYKELLNNITTFVFDVDGVLTKNSLLISSQGELLRQVHAKDSYAIERAIGEGYKVCFMSHGDIRGLRMQLKLINVSDVFLKVTDKAEQLDIILEKDNIKREQVLYMGDDIPDSYPMHMVGLPCCPQDAVPEIKAISKYVSHQYGGKGCVRDVIEQVMKVQGKWLNNFS